MLPAPSAFRRQNSKRNCVPLPVWTSIEELIWSGNDFVFLDMRIGRREFESKFAREAQAKARDRSVNASRCVHYWLRRHA